MASKKSYSRYFIILQEDEKGYVLEREKSSSGYVKLEKKNNKCKVSFYAQNINPNMEPYYMVLVCSDKGKDKLAVIGKLPTDEQGKIDVTNEYDLENIGNAKISMTHIKGACIAKVIDNNIISLMSGFTNNSVPKDWKGYEVIKVYEEKEKEKEKLEETMPKKEEKKLKNVKKEKREEVKEEVREEGKEEIEEKVFVDYEEKIQSKIEEKDDSSSRDNDAEKEELNKNTNIEETIKENKTELEKSRVEVEENKTEPDNNRIEEEKDKTKKDKNKIEIEDNKSETDKTRNEAEKDKTEKDKTEKEKSETDNSKVVSENKEMGTDNNRAQVEEDKAKVHNKVRVEEDTTKTDSNRSEKEKDKTENDKNKAEVEEKKAEMDNNRAEVEDKKNLVEAQNRESGLEEEQIEDSKCKESLEHIISNKTSEEDYIREFMECDIPYDSGEDLEFSTLEESMRKKKKGKKEENKKEESYCCLKDYPIGRVGSYFKGIACGFEEMGDMFREIPHCRWYKVPVTSLEDMYDNSDYHRYTVIYYPMICYYSYIARYEHFCLGYKCNKDGKLMYILYAIPGKKDMECQPYRGRTGFVTWVPSKDKKDNGYWIMFYDFRKSTVVVPIKK